MADATYQTAVYRKQGGNELVAADGGQITFEDGSIMSLEDGFTFYLGSSSYTLDLQDLMNMLYYNKTVATYGMASVSATAPIPSQIAPQNRFVKISMTSNFTTETLWFGSAPSAGMEMYITIAPGSVASGALTISCSTGVSLVTINGSDQSRIIMYNSTNSFGRVHLVCFTDGEWSVVEIGSATATVFT